MSSNLSIKNDDGIVTLTLNRAPVNAMNPDFLGEIEAGIAALARDDSARAVVIDSGCKVFSAGLDLREMQGYGPEDQTRIVDALNSAFLGLYGFPKPLVAAVDGAAIAGGLFVPLSADHTVTTGRAKFGLAEVQVGANFPVAPMEIARAEMIPQGLRRLMLSGRPVDASTAQAMGIADVIVEGDALADTAQQAARALSAAPAGTYAAVKAQIRAPVIEKISAAIRGQNDPARQGWFTEETKAAMAKALVR